jgi:hypothetical protein
MNMSGSCEAANTVREGPSANGITNVEKNKRQCRLASLPSTTPPPLSPPQMPPSKFDLFPALPPELRFQIWETALSVQSVWSAVRVPAGASDSIHQNNRAYTMTFVGPAPHVAGMACREAWRLLKRSYGRPVRGPAGSTGTARSYWVNLNHTVICLGFPLDAVAVLAGFDTEALSRFKHVVLTWHLSQFGELARACKHLANACPNLSTIIIQWCETERTSAKSPQQPMGLETATYYAAIPAYTGCQLGCDALDMSYFRALLLQYFGNPLPRLHLLAPGSAQRLSA